MGESYKKIRPIFNKIKEKVMKELTENHYLDNQKLINLIGD
jgi:hypothetical protein